MHSSAIIPAMMLLLLAACTYRAETQVELERLATENAAQEVRLGELEAEVEQLRGDVTELKAQQQPTPVPSTYCRQEAEVFLYTLGSVKGHTSTLSDSLQSAIRMVPHKNGDGEIDGYRMSGIRRNSLFASCGIKNGDIIHSINGVTISKRTECEEAVGYVPESYVSCFFAPWQQLINGELEEFDIKLTRRNRPGEFQVRAVAASKDAEE